jgi:tRNA(fMet)-specific endonuclease VapC
MEELKKGYCIDSDILIDYLRGIENARLFLIEAGKNATLYISVVSVVELYAGKETKQEEKRERIERFLKEFVVIPMDESLAQVAGEFRRDYGKPFADMIVAASAHTYHLRLATRNIKHFEALGRGTARLSLVTPY